MNIRKILLMLAILLLLPFTIKVFGSDSEQVASPTRRIQVVVRDDLTGSACSSRAVGLSDIAGALRVIGAAPRDIIVLFQVIKQAGMLRTEFVVAY